MIGNVWISSDSASEKFAISETDISYLRESGFLKPGIHWKSSPYGQKKPWNPEVLYNIKLCPKIINKYYPKEKYDQNVA